MALEAFSGKSLEAFIDSGLESRGFPPTQLFVVCALERQPNYSLSAFDEHMRLFDIIETESEERDINIGVLVYSYLPFPNDLDPTNTRVVPEGRIFPRNEWMSTAGSQPQRHDSSIPDTRPNLIAAIERQVSGPIDANTWIIFAYAVGKITLSQWGQVPQNVVSSLRARYPDALVGSIAQGDEEWGHWFIDQWEALYGEIEE